MSNIPATNYWPLEMWVMYLILINLHLNGHLWLETTILDPSGLDSYKGKSVTRLG